MTFKEIAAAKVARRKAEKTIKDAEVVRVLPGGGKWKFDAEDEKVVVIDSLSEADAIQLATDLAAFFA